MDELIKIDEIEKAGLEVLKKTMDTISLNNRRVS